MLREVGYCQIVAEKKSADAAKADDRRFSFFEEVTAPGLLGEIEEVVEDLNQRNRYHCNNVKWNQDQVFFDVNQK